MKHKKLYWVGVFLLCCIPALWGIFHPGFFVSDDGHWMVIRLSAFYEALVSGQFPVRFLPRLNQGIGYPVADFLYPLFLYIGSLLHVLKIPFLLDIKVLFATGIVFSGLGMVLFLRKNFGTLPSFLGGVLYMYLPYHLYDVYVRGSLGEVVALAVVPYAFWAIERNSWALTACFVGLLILSHNTLALFFLPVLLAYAFVKKMSLGRICLFVVCGLGVSSFFWIPALFDKQFTVFDTVAVASPFGYFVNGISYQLIGWIGVVIFGGTLSFRSALKKGEVLFFFLLGLFSLFFSFSISSIFWNSKLLAAFVQFPFRFLSLTLVAESFLAAYIFEKLQSNRFLLVLLLLLLGFSAWPYLFPSEYDYYPDSYYATNVDSTTVKNEYMPIWVVSQPTTYASQRVLLDKNAGTISDISAKGTRMTFALHMARAVTVETSFSYFPGWMATIDGQSVVAVPSRDTGLVQVAVPKGNHTVGIQFGETPVRLFADMLSLLTIGFLLVTLLKRHYEK